MEALVFTHDSKEYDTVKNLLEGEAGLIDVSRAALDGHNHFSREYDIVIVALSGALGMEKVLGYKEHFKDTQIIWISDDSYFAGIALRNHIHSFIVRPYDEEQLRKAIKEAVPKCPNRNRWSFYPENNNEEEN